MPRSSSPSWSLQLSAKHIGLHKLRENEAQGWAPLAIWLLHLSNILLVPTNSYVLPPVDTPSTVPSL
jgi:hypothetical protein